MAAGGKRSDSETGSDSAEAIVAVAIVAVAIVAVAVAITVAITGAIAVAVAGDESEVGRIRFCGNCNRNADAVIAVAAIAKATIAIK